MGEFVAEAVSRGDLTKVSSLRESLWKKRIFLPSAVLKILAVPSGTPAFFALQSDRNLRPFHATQSFCKRPKESLSLLT